MMKKILLLSFLAIAFKSYSQTTHQINVAINQGASCPIVKGLEDSPLFKVFPNPATKSFTIQTDLQGTEVQLFDLRGKKIRSLSTWEYQTVVDVEGLPKGLYFLQFQNGVKVEQTKILVK